MSLIRRTNKAGVQNVKPNANIKILNMWILPKYFGRFYSGQFRKSNNHHHHHHPQSHTWTLLHHIMRREKKHELWNCGWLLCYYIYQFMEVQSLCVWCALNMNKFLWLSSLCLGCHDNSWLRCSTTYFYTPCFKTIVLANIACFS